jgi:CBS-domain-containing membrane protein
MRVADLMHSDVKSLSEDDTLGQVIQALSEMHIGGMPVLNTQGHMVGIVSRSDVLELEAETSDRDERDRIFEQTVARDIMTARPLGLPPDADIREAAQQMLYAGVHRIFVEEGGKLVGVLSQSDIVEAVANGLLREPVTGAPAPFAAHS